MIQDDGKKWIVCGTDLREELTKWKKRKPGRELSNYVQTLLRLLSISWIKKIFY